jgi:hypothetical protein
VVCVVAHDKYIYLTSELGHVFTFPTLFVVGQPFATKVDCGSALSMTLAETTQLRKGTNITGNMSATSLNKQAEMFLNMIVEVVEQAPDETVAVLPSLHALNHCMRSGWQPGNIPQVSITIMKFDYLRAETDFVV